MVWRLEALVLLSGMEIYPPVAFSTPESAPSWNWVAFKREKELVAVVEVPVKEEAVTVPSKYPEPETPRLVEGVVVPRPRLPEAY